MRTPRPTAPHTPTPGTATPHTATPRTLADVIRDQAADALERGEQALAADDLAWARAWFERAQRLLPADPSIIMALAGVTLRLGDPVAAALYARASGLADTREIWMGLAAASVQVGDRAGARAALMRLLSRHVLPRDTGDIGRLAALVDGSAGWCGVVRSADGAGLEWVGSGVSAVRLDGRRVSSARLPDDGGRLVAPGAALPCQPIDLRRLRAVEGLVEACEGGLSGWAWLPADADTDPWITITAAGNGGCVRLQAVDSGMAALRPLTRPRRFGMAAADLAGMTGMLHVTGEDGRALAGSPLDPGGAIRAAREASAVAALECPAVEPMAGPAADPPSYLALSAPAGIVGPAAAAVADPLRPVAVVVPVYRDRSLTMACLRAVLATPAAGLRLIVVDDATPEPELAADLDALAESGAITLLRHTVNRGFPVSANDGLRAAFALSPPHDALLLNSDALVPVGHGAGRPSWLERLRAAVHAAADIGTASPLSNDATILSYPARDGANPAPSARALARLDKQAARANPAVVIDIPTTVGFCMYLRRDCAVQTGLFRPSLFAQGYGEENDFCIRARHFGWRHVAVPGVFVAHGGDDGASASFGQARSPLVARNLAVLEQIHPGYHALIAAYQRDVPAQDALAPARRRLDALRWAAGRKPAAVVLVTHDSGGGVERVVRRRVREIAAAGMRPVVLRPVLDPNSDGGVLPGLCAVAEAAQDPGAGAGTPNLIFDLPREMAELARLLRGDRPALLEVHHRLGHHASILQLGERLGIPVEFRLHDYASFCPRISLVGPDQRYCGEPEEVATCEACVADAGSRIDEAIGVAALRARSAAEFAGARRVVVPSGDMANRLRRHFPGLTPTVMPLEDDAALPFPPVAAPVSPMVVCVIGAIGVEKGFDILLACARDAAMRDLPLEFRLVGHSTDDSRLMDTGRVFVTGRYQEADAEALIRAQRAQLAFLPSIWPETWGFTLGLAWRAGLRAAVFDVGAMGARVRATGFGLALPLGLSAGGINQALLLSQTGGLAAAPQDRLRTGTTPVL